MCPTDLGICRSMSGNHVSYPIQSHYGYGDNVGTRHSDFLLIYLVLVLASMSLVAEMLYVTAMISSKLLSGADRHCFLFWAYSQVQYSHIILLLSLIIL